MQLQNWKNYKFLFDTTLINHATRIKSSPPPYPQSVTQPNKSSTPDASRTPEQEDPGSDSQLHPEVIGQDISSAPTYSDQLHVAFLGKGAKQRIKEAGIYVIDPYAGHNNRPWSNERSGTWLVG